MTTLMEIRMSDIKTSNFNFQVNESVFDTEIWLWKSDFDDF